MKIIFRHLIVAICFFTGTNPLHAQWIQTGSYNYRAVWAFALSGPNLFAGADGRGVFLPTNIGTSWTEVNTGLTNTIICALAVTGTHLFAGTAGAGGWTRPLSEMTSVVVNEKRATGSYEISFDAAQLASGI